MPAQLSRASARARRSARWKRVSLENAFGLRPTALAEDAAQVSLADAEVCGNGVDVGAAEAIGGGERETRGYVARLHRGAAIGDRALQDARRIHRGARTGESIAESSRSACTPELFERGDATDHLERGHPDHVFLRVESEARRDRPMTTAKGLAVHDLTRAERMHVEPAASHGPATYDELDLGPRDRHVRTVLNIVTHHQARVHGPHSEPVPARRKRCPFLPSRRRVRVRGQRP